MIDYHALSDDELRRLFDTMDRVDRREDVVELEFIAREMLERPWGESFVVAMTRSDDGLRVSAALSALGIRDLLDRDVLTDAAQRLLDSGDSLLQTWAIDALALSSAKDLDDIVRASDFEQSDIQKGAYLRYVASTSTREETEALALAALKDGRPIVIESALDVLADGSFKVDLAQIVPLLEHPAPNVRAAAEGLVDVSRALEG